jgi:hypothetical protein
VPRKSASTGVPLAWSLLTEGATNASLEAHRLRQMVNRALVLVETSEKRDHLYEVAGDLLTDFPRHLQHLERHLDRLNYALASVGTKQYRDRIPLVDRYKVDYAMQDAAFPLVSDVGQSPFPPPKPETAAQRVARRYTMQREADLNPPLGVPGGPCYVMQRIKDRVRNPKVRDELIADVEIGTDLNNQEASKVYSLEGERGAEGTPFKSLALTAHVQFRMDQRAVSVSDIRAALLKFHEAYGKEKSRNSPLHAKWERELDLGQPLEWDSPTGLTVVFSARNAGVDAKGRKLRQALLVTTYWRGKPNPLPTPVNSCPTM